MGCQGSPPGLSAETRGELRAGAQRGVRQCAEGQLSASSQRCLPDCHPVSSALSQLMKLLLQSMRLQSQLQHTQLQSQLMRLLYTPLQSLPMRLQFQLPPIRAQSLHTLRRTHQTTSNPHIWLPLSLSKFHRIVAGISTVFARCIYLFTRVKYTILNGK